MSQYDRQFFEYFNWLKRSMENRALMLGGFSASGGGAGGPPGGFTGMLPQTRVSYDYSEAAVSGFVGSGYAISGTLLDNLNHIRYRIATLEGERLQIQYNDALVASGIYVVNFEGDASVTDNGSGKVTVVISGGVKNFTALDDVPDSYVGEAGKIVAVKGDETGVEFIAASGVVDSLKTKVSSDDTTEDFLDAKIVGGTNISVTTVSGGGNEHLEVSLNRQVKVMGIGDANVITSGNLGLRLRSPYSGEITNVVATLEEAPTGSDAIFDIYKNGSSIFTTSANRPTIADGTNDDLSSVPDDVYFVENDIFTFYVSQMGSTTPGSGLMIQIRCLV